jgi:hypothetical protein
MQPTTQIGHDFAIFKTTKNKNKKRDYGFKVKYETK